MVSDQALREQEGDRVRIMGLDVGDASIGVALSDPLGWTAQGLASLRRHGKSADLLVLQGLIAQHQVTEVVVGLPLNMNGSLGPQATKTLTFVEELRRQLGIPVLTWDERLTTRAAEQVLLQANLSRRKRRGKIDQVAAQLILQGFLDRRRASASKPADAGNTGDA